MRNSSKDTLPEACYSVLPSSGEIILIKLGEHGFYRTEYSVKDKDKNRALATELNEERGITKSQEKAMVSGSMFGWHVPGAKPSAWENENN